MEARFIGDPQDDFAGPKTINMYGVSFVKDEWTPLGDMKPEHVAKLEWNTHFETRKAKGKTEQRREIVADLVESGAMVANPFDQDGDGKPGGPVRSPEKDTLIAKLEKIPGADFKRTWGVPRLQAALDAMEASKADDVAAAAKAEADKWLNGDDED